MKEFIYNPINDKSPCGACVKGTIITYEIKVSKFFVVDGVDFVVHMDGKENKIYPMKKSFVDEKYEHYRCVVNFEEVGFYWYHFEAISNGSIIKLVRSDNLDVVRSQADSDYLQLVINSESTTDSSFRKGVIYHIFVDRFNRVGDVKERKGLHLVEDWNTPIEKEYENGERVNNNCYGGNFAGIIDKLSYLKTLGVSSIYLSPVFEANSSHKYDVADYSKVDSMFGTNEEFQDLISKAKKQGMKVIIDGVFNHTGSDSIYFNKNGRYKTVGAYQSQNSKYYDWYDFSSYPESYSCWWGIKTLPQTNEDSGFFKYIAGKNGIIEKYMSLGLGGFRLDVVDELSNNFMKAICSASKGINPKSLIIGEVWEDASSKISYDERKEYFLGGNLDSVTNYPMKNAILEFVKYGNVNAFVNTVNLILDQYPKSIQNNLMNFLDTHDTMRALTYLGVDENNPEFNINENYRLSPTEKSRAIELLKIATIIQYTVMGIPTIFYGDEAGIEGTKDPYCRAPYPWDNQDKELLEWYTMLGTLRSNKVFDGGSFKIKYAENSVLIYEREKDLNKVMVAVNRSSEDFDFVLGKTMCDFLSGEYVSGKITLKKDTAKIFIL